MRKESSLEVEQISTSTEFKNEHLENAHYKKHCLTRYSEVTGKAEIYFPAYK
jgi:hypothetical protein